MRGRIGDLLRYTQVLTLERHRPVQCTTTIGEFTGADRLVRLRWPLPGTRRAAGQQVGDAVIGRGFGLMNDHDPGRTAPSTPATHPWTLDKPAHSWSGLSSAVRVRVGRGEGSGVRAVSVARWCGPRDHRRNWPWHLMVALGAPGHRHLQFRRPHPLRAPRRRLQPAGRPSRSAAPTTTRSPPRCWPPPTNTYTAELHRQLAATGQARVWVPAATLLERVWRPDADLRDALTRRC